MQGVISVDDTGSSQHQEPIAELGIRDAHVPGVGRWNLGQVS